MENDNRFEKAKNFLYHLICFRRMEGEFELFPSQLQTVLYLGVNGYISSFDERDLDSKKSRNYLFDLTRKVEGIKLTDLWSELFLLPAQGSRIVRGLEEKNYTLLLNAFNCERIKDRRIMEIVLSRKGNEVFEKIIERF